MKQTIQVWIQLIMEKTHLSHELSCVTRPDIHTLLQHVGEPSAAGDITSPHLDFHTLLRGVRVRGGVPPGDSMSFVVSKKSSGF